MTSVDRALRILDLFTGPAPEWTVEDAAQTLGLSQSTAYQYFRSLVEVGLLSTYKTGCYVVGPAIIALDRQARFHDPLILAARDAMDLLGEHLAEDDFVLLCRIYKFTVMCVDQRAPRAPVRNVSYERGLPMPLERGAASKVILAHLAPRVLRRYYERTYPKLENPSWVEFRKSLRAIRKSRLCITYGELDAGRVGVSAPVFSGTEVIGSIGLVLSTAQLQGGIPDLETQQRVAKAGEEVSAAMTMGR